MEHHLTERNEIRPRATTQGNFEGLMLNDGPMPNAYFRLPFICNVQNRQIYQTRSRQLQVAWAGERREERLNTAGMREVCGKVETSSNWIEGWLHNSVNLLTSTELYI